MNENINENINEKKKNPKTRIIVIIVSLIIVVTLLAYGVYGALQNQGEETDQSNQEKQAFEVETSTINNATSTNESLFIEAVG
jgi:flagellar basal body-associated protein FliL